MALAAIRTGDPMSELNTPPLIDVMLVLLVMIIITVPVATHSTDMNLPQPCVEDCPELPLSPVKNKIVLTPDDRILWNGVPIDDRALVRNLQITRQFDVEPELQFQPEASASYDLVVRVLHIIKSSGVTRFGFVGNERYARFEAAG